jgi:hypothetical protein
MSRRRWVTAAVGAAGVAAAAVAVVVTVGSAGDDAPPTACRVGTGPTALVLSTEQAQNASTIAAVGTREGLGARAVTIALATALRESKLFNLPYGDRDSVGLFQQRPSQGWGATVDLMRPAFAAAAFYDRLRTVPGWRHLPLASAAQEVQRSIDGAAYAQFGETGRVLAEVLTGQVPAGITCTFERSVDRRPQALRAAMAEELGSPPDGGRVAVDDRWRRAHWLVCHAYAYGIETVAAQGRRWTRGSGEWRSDPAAGPPRYVLVRPV